METRAVEGSRMMDLIHLDDPVLVGGFLFLKEKTTSQDAANKSLMEAWRDAGEKFLRRTSSKKHASPNQITTSRTAPQSPQKQPLQREA